MARDYYEVLGVPRGADKDQIKSAFRRLAREYHPDVTRLPKEEAEARFKEANEAYEILSDDEKRARYDRFGHAGVAGAAGGSGFNGAGFSGFEEIFEEFFSNLGGMRSSSRRRGPRQGADRRADVTVTFEESVFGVEKQIEFDRMENCDTCAGSGAAPGTSPTKCPQCNGAGEVRQVQQTFLGPMVQVATCPRCGGKGEVIATPCQTCKGAGRQRKRATLAVQIPPGVREGLQIQIRAEGDAGDANAPKGNLFVVVHVQEHEFFKRKDNDIILDIAINVAQAALGDHLVVPTVDGDVELTIPPGTQTGRVFRLRGKGVPRLRSDGSNSGRGDQLVYVQVEVPTRLTDEQRVLFEQLAATMGGVHSTNSGANSVNPQRNGKGFFDRVRDMFTGE
ncbi:molecular chaperone DnaJ [Anaerolineae bacterium CFX9]|jgi:molecular chaperone DnaJ|nr:molecular chaperone DnaJ [Anaerolineae bacterium CFX9]